MEKYAYVVVHDVVARAVAEVSVILDAESLRLARATSLTALVTDITAVLEQELSHLSHELSHARSHA